MNLRAYDSYYPYNYGFATVTIFVVRNPSAPQFTLTNYVETINENYLLGEVVVDVQASDLDGVRVATHFIV